MRVAVRPAHAAAGRSRREMRPLHMAEILVVERVGQRAAMILEGVDWAVLGVENRAMIADFRERVADQPAGGECRRDCVERKVDRALLIEVNRREIEQPVAEDRLAQPRFPDQLRPKHRDGLEVRASVKPMLQIAQKRADILDEILENAGPVLALYRVHLVPQIPGEDYSAAAPAGGGEGEPRLDQRPRLGAGQEPRAVDAG